MRINFGGGMGLKAKLMPSGFGGGGGISIEAVPLGFIFEHQGTVSFDAIEAKAEDRSGLPAKLFTTLESMVAERTSGAGRSLHTA